MFPRLCSQPQKSW